MKAERQKAEGWPVPASRIYSVQVVAVSIDFGSSVPIVLGDAAGNQLN
ncbi:MAG: hypothetical protein WDN75_11745 [Bacteroidota bacterium]